ncbi:MAG: RNA-directed DNA polymerase, partial [Bacteroidales bacterium]|nr:RNA-directed DNA polymerase [Bacteroidales bacterium]
MKNILSLSHDEALDFLMDTKQYCGFELPEYFVFNRVLTNVREAIGHKPYVDCVGQVAPDDVDGVNVDVVISKDGKHGIRKLILANPYLYYFLCREICDNDAWQALKQCFELFQVPTITVPSLPVVSEQVEKFHRAATILNWWKCVEQRTISLSLDYRYMFVTDITNCYSSINPQSIEWALTRKGTQYSTDENRELARNMQSLLRAMQHGHNVGIPMGSTLFDFIAEIVLGYADLLLYEELESRGIKNYEIIRYRDDYRIFCNDKGVLEQISYVLQDVLGSLNFTFNAGKTQITDDIVTGAIKTDKLWDIYNTPVYSKGMSAFDTIQKHLLYILQFSRKFP